MNETTSAKASSSPETTLSTGTKRKRNADPKFYAVRLYVFLFRQLCLDLTGL